MMGQKRRRDDGKNDGKDDGTVKYRLDKKIQEGHSTPKKKQKKLNNGEKASPSSASAVHDEASPPTVDSKKSSNPQAQKSLFFSNGVPESSMVMKRLKDLCSMKEPTVNVGIEIVGAAYLLKLMTTRTPSCDDDHDDDDDKVGLAMKQAVEAAKLLFQADHLRNNVLQLVSKSQKLFDKDL